MRPPGAPCCLEAEGRKKKMSCDCAAVLGNGVVSVSDGALELLARLSDLRHRLHPLVVIAQGARLHGEQRHLWVTQEEDVCEV